MITLVPFRFVGRVGVVRPTLPLASGPLVCDPSLFCRLALDLELELGMEVSSLHFSSYLLHDGMVSMVSLVWEQVVWDGVTALVGLLWSAVTFVVRPCCEDTKCIFVHLFNI